MPYLVHKDHDGSVIQFWNLHDGALTVGRGGDVNGKVEDPELSRKHFVVTPEPAGFTLKDLASKNGTVVNGEKVTERVLRPNDTIRAGGSRFAFVDGLTTMAGKLDQDIQQLSRQPLDSPESGKK